MLTDTQTIDPIRAVTHRDPYPYYAELVAQRPFYFDDALGCWVASSAEAVRAVLTDQHCRVRPPSEPIPNALLGSPLADLFGQLARQNDGAFHQALKPPLRSTLAALNADQVREQARKSARVLFAKLRPEFHPHRLTNFSFRLPVDVVATLLGAPEAALPQIVLWVSAYVRAVAPGATQAQLWRGKLAARNLFEHFSEPLGENDLLATLARQACAAERSAVVANAIGLLIQSYEATAGLIGNTVLRFAADLALRRQADADPALLPSIIAEVLRYDAPVQNTRRFSATTHVLNGQTIREGDALLVILAEANRDPAANPDPDRFDPHRSDRQLFTFGVGAHACPGEQLATTIAVAGLETILASSLDLERLAASATYRFSANTRIPLFAQESRS